MGKWYCILTVVGFPLGNVLLAFPVSPVIGQTARSRGTPPANGARVNHTNALNGSMSVWLFYIHVFIEISSDSGRFHTMGGWVWAFYTFDPRFRLYETVHVIGQLRALCEPAISAVELGGSRKRKERERNSAETRKRVLSRPGLG